MHISKGVVMTVRELDETDPIYLKHHAPPTETKVAEPLPSPQEEPDAPQPIYAKDEAG